MTFGTDAEAIAGEAQPEQRQRADNGRPLPGDEPPSNADDANETEQTQR